MTDEEAAEYMNTLIAGFQATLFAAGDAKDVGHEGSAMDGYVKFDSPSFIAASAYFFAQVGYQMGSEDPAKFETALEHFTTQARDAFKEIPTHLAEAQSKLAGDKH